MTSTLRTLIVEDSEDDFLLLIRTLKRGGYDPVHRCVDNREDLCKALEEESWDIMLSDYRMPGFSGEEALRICREHELDTPFIIISGAVGEEAAVALMKAGAHDFVRKDNLSRLVPAIERELNERDTRLQRHLAEEALRESEEKYRTLVDSSPDAILSLDTHGRILSFNIAATRIWGREFGEVAGKTFEEAKIVAQDSLTLLRQELKWVLAENMRLPFEVTTIDRDGKEVFVEANCLPIFREGEVVGVHATLRNVTERRKLEEQLRLAQKMEAIGQLAGGVAHDFNNQLSGIIGCAEILKTEVGTTPHLSWYADTIINAAERAAALTRQLLAFARRNKYQTIPVHIHAVISEVISLLEHTLDPRIDIVRKLEAPNDMVSGDPSQLQNAILNLAVNAGDAMPEGGKLTFRTSTIELDDDFCRSRPEKMTPGEFLVVAVQDSGMGIGADILPHIFEPFFTTKELGKGTGLGLAAVYGAVSSHEGTIEASSELGKGSVFKIFIPLRADGDNVVGEEEEEPHVGGSGHIMIVDDEEIVRSIAERMLVGLGYDATVCSNGSKAVEYYEEHHDSVDLVLLDMVMPKMNGRDTFFALRDIDPNVKVLLATGHAVGDEIQELLDNGVLGLLQKPFRIGELAKNVRALIDL